MKISSYKYIKSTECRDGMMIIPDIDRAGYTTQELGLKVKEHISGIKTNGKTALLIAGGPAIHHSDNKVVNDTYSKGSVVVKSQLGYSAYSIARMFSVDIDFMSINTNTCASGMYSLYEASGLLDSGYTDVIVYAADIVDEAQKLLFTQLGIDLVCGDGVVVIHLTNYSEGVEITEVVWKWNKDSSPMSVTSEGYNRVLKELDLSDIDVVKAHGSGTARNTEAELSSISKYLPLSSVVEYKSIIGHTQGVSALIELCMLIDDKDVEWNTAIALASGLGGFYGGCKLRRA